VILRSLSFAPLQIHTSARNRLTFTISLEWLILLLLSWVRQISQICFLYYVPQSCVKRLFTLVFWTNKSTMVEYALTFIINHLHISGRKKHVGD